MKHELFSDRPVFSRRSVNSALSAMAVTGLLAGCDRAQASPVSPATLVGTWKAWVPGRARNGGRSAP